MVQYASATIEGHDDGGDGDGHGARASTTEPWAGEEDGSARASSSSMAAAAVIGFSPDDNTYYGFREQAGRTDDDDRPQAEMLKGVFLRGVRTILPSSPSPNTYPTTSSSSSSHPNPPFPPFPSPFPLGALGGPRP